MEEVWKDIKGYDGDYQVSNLGRVRSLKFNKNKIIKFGTLPQGYKFCIFSKDGITKNYRINRLVAETFINNLDNKPCVNHKNGIKDDNRVINLEWVTHSENTKHAYNNGLLYRGIKHHNAKLSKQDVLDIRKLKKFFTYDELAIIFNVSRTTCSDIIRGRYWKHI